MINKELEKLQNDYNEIIRRCEDITNGLTIEQINWKPAPEKWSIAECLKHLTITNDLYIKNAKPVIEKALAKNQTGDSPIKIGMIGKIFMGFEPPPKRKFKVPKLFSPRKESTKIYTSEVNKDFIRSKNNMIDLIEKSNGLDLNKVKLASPVTKMIKIRLGEYFSIMAPHDRRHLWQAENIKKSQNFPSV